jgi:glycerol uptake facilitator-like aquaporin
MRVFALTFGFVIVALIYSFSHVSGTHFNPAVTIACYAMGEFDRKRLLPYVSAQILGGITASVVLFLSTSRRFYRALRSQLFRRHCHVAQWHNRLVLSFCLYLF